MERLTDWKASYAASPSLMFGNAVPSNPTTSRSPGTARPRRAAAQIAPTASDRKTYLEQAQILQKQAMDLRKEQQAAADAAAAAVPPEAIAE